VRYSTEEDIIIIEYKELVASARRGMATLPSRDEDEPSVKNSTRGGLSTDTCVFSLDGMIGDLSYRIVADEPRYTDSEIWTSFSLEGISASPNKAERAQARGEGFILALIAVRLGFIKAPYVKINTVYTSEQNGNETVQSESVAVGRLEAFLKKCLDTLIKFSVCEIERQKERIPSMKAAKFPYKKKRQGQDEFIKAAYRTLAKGGELFATAPTGTGKTVSAIFPAVRALGDGRCDKIFYLTPKTTTARAAEECIGDFYKNGVKIRSISLIAKDRQCFRGLLCRTGVGEGCPTEGENRLAEATLALFGEGLPTVTYADVKRYAKEYTVCPYELSLSYSELCDIVICDFNYLFDPQVYIKRFFTDGGNFGFLIDEAHNLADRARNMYSAEISCEEISTAAENPLFGDFSSYKRALADFKIQLHKTLYPLIRDEIRETGEGKYAAYHSKTLPAELFSYLEGVISKGEEELLSAYRAKDGEKVARVRFIKDTQRDLKKLLSIMNMFDDSFEMFVFLEDENIKLKLFCLDTGEVIRQRLSLGKSAVFFSGTLSPVDYYKSVLGGDRSSSQLSVDSPFVSEQLSVCVMDKVSTRYTERDDTLLAVCRIIAATLSAKRGHYMIFTPSFVYAEALYKVFCAKYPKIKSLLQKSDMTQSEKQEFLNAFSDESDTYLAAFCVMGGIYSEGIDLSGDKLIGAVIVGIGMPSISYEREAISAYYDEKMEAGRQYAYIYPGMNRVLQAAGRVIRHEDDKGVIVLIDDRFDDPLYKKTAPSLWRGMKFLSDAKELKMELEEFWKS